MKLINTIGLGVTLVLCGACSGQVGESQAVDATSDSPDVEGKGALGSVEESLTSAQIDGIYAGNDGGTYYVRSNAARTQLFWYGENASGSFANIAAGTATETPATLDHFWAPHWMDVPKAPSAGEGDLALHLTPGHITKLVGVGFGATAWTKLAMRPERTPINVRRVATGSGATGTWIGSDRGVYFVRESGGRFGWFGQVCSVGDGVPVSGNVFQTTLVSGRASGQWADVPYGSNNNLIDLAVNVGSDRITAVAGVPGRTWNRVRSFETDLISALVVKVRTGGDDLRAGSIAYGTVELRGGITLPPFNLNGGANWPNNSVRTVSIPLPLGTRVRDIAAFRLLHDGAPRNFGDTYDNWNADSLQVSYTRSDVSCPLQIGQTLVPGRMTGERTFFRGSLD